MLALAQLRRLDEFVARRREIAARYDALLAKRPIVEAPRVATGTSPVWYKYPVLLPAGVDRDGLRKRLQEEHAIECGALYSPPCHLMPSFQRELGTGPGMLPTAEALLSRQLTLPMHAAMEPAEADRAVDALEAVLPPR